MATYSFSTPDGNSVTLEGNGRKHACAKAAVMLGGIDPKSLQGGKVGGRNRNGRKPWKPSRYKGSDYGYGSWSRRY